MYNVIVNNNHPLVKEILEQKEDLISKEAINTEDNKEKKKEIVTNFAKSNSLLKQIVDLALLSNGLLKGEELKTAISEYIKNKDSNLTGKMESQGTTPRRLTDLIGSLCDLTSGSGDKGTPIVFVQGYFDNYTK